MDIQKHAFVVIPNWNGIQFIANCLESLSSQADAYTVVVVDNGSVDGSIELIRDNYPDISLIKLDRNYGFAGGVNRGIEYALECGAEYIALFNNDAEADKNWLARLVEAANQHPEAGIITSKFLKFDKKTIDSTGDFYSIWGYAFPRGRDEKDNGRYDKGEFIFSGSGGASLYRASMLREIGLFDETFFAYFEDVDISFRAQLAGWKVWYEPTAIAYHHIGATSSKHGNFARYHTFKNFPLLYTKNMPEWLYFKYLPRMLAAYGLMILRDLSRGSVPTTVRGVGAAMYHLPGAFIKRLSIQARRRVSLSYIDNMLYHDMPPTQKTLLRALNKLRSLK